MSNRNNNARIFYFGNNEFVAGIPALEPENEEVDLFMEKAHEAEIRSKAWLAGYKQACADIKAELDEVDDGK